MRILTPALISLLYLSSFTPILSSHASEGIVRDDSRDSFLRGFFSSREHMTGNWGGVRQRLVEWGLTPRASYYMTVMGNPDGGEKKGVQYAGLLNAALDFDLEKLLNLDGTRFVVSGSWASGRSLSIQDIGNFFDTSEVFSGRSVRLYQLFLESHLFEERLEFAIGRMAIANVFTHSWVYNYYVSSAIDGFPGSFEINDPAFFINPQTAWGARVRLEPLKEIYIMAGVYNANPEVGRDSAHGVDFSFRDGVILIGELGYMRNRDEASTGLPGNYKFGAFYDSGNFEKVSDGSSSDKGNFGMYWLVDQMIYSEAESGDQGLTPWAAVTLSAPSDINTFTFFVSGGFVYDGLISGRDEDAAAFGFAYGKISNDLEGRDYEMILELTYIFEIAEWLQFQPDIQFIVHPGGSGGIPNALVIGTQIGVDI